MSGLLASPEKKDGPVSLRQRGHPQHCAAARGSQDDLHPLHVGQLLVSGNRVLGAALRVLDDELQLSSVDAARGVDLVGRHPLGLVGHRAIGLARARQRFHHADPERALLLIVTAAASQGRQRQNRHQPENEESLVPRPCQEAPLT